MKRIFALVLGTMMLGACNNATDGDADTDTTSFPVDTLTNNAGDTAGHINTNTGTYSTDTTTSNLPKDGSSKPTPPASRKSTPHDPARIDTMKQ